jgi:hypothetical protein
VALPHHAENFFDLNDVLEKDSIGSVVKLSHKGKGCELHEKEKRYEKSEVEGKEKANLSDNFRGEEKQTKKRQ